MSTKVGLAFAAFFPPGLSSGKPGRVRSCVLHLVSEAYAQPILYSIPLRVYCPLRQRLHPCTW